MQRVRKRISAFFVGGLVFLSYFLLITPSPAFAIAFPCGTEGCAVAGGTYQLALPENGAAPEGIVLHFHGWGGRARGLMRNSGLAKVATDRGYALLAPQGQVPPGRENTNWRVPSDNGGGSRSGRDDDAFVDAILADVNQRFGLGDERILVTGFSLGGMYAWHLACRRGDRFTAFAPIAGVIWKPIPTACPGTEGPIHLLHTHGFTDTMVPLEGRNIRNGTIIQGDVFAMLDVARGHNRCTQERPSGFAKTQSMQCRLWEDCGRGSVGFCLHSGGHSVPKDWSSYALDWFESRLP